MGWAGQTWATVTAEQAGAYGTYYGAGAKLYPTLYGGNAFTARIVPQRQVIRTADGGNRRKFVVANRKVVVGSLTTLMHPDQMAYWVTSLIPSGGLLPSYTFDFWDSIQAWRLVGGCVSGLTITSSAQADYATLKVDFVFQKRDATFTTFAAPAQTNYSTLIPYQFVECAGNVKLAGSAITLYKALGITIKNTLAGTWDEQPYISSLYYAGRDLDFSLGPQYLATTQRGYFEAQTALTWVLNWTRVSPAHAFTVTCETNNYVSNVQDELPLDGPGYQALDLQCFYDAANTADFTLTAT